MTKETYIRITGRLRENPRRVWLLEAVNRVLTGIVFFLYPFYLCRLFLDKDPFLPRAVLVPAVSFAAVSLFRRIFNAKRPYEKFDIPPVIRKDTSGKSFPSRHVFSVFMIGITVFTHYPGAGLMLGVIGVALGAIRVVGGVHEPRDVAAGAVAGILCGVAGYYLV